MNFATIGTSWITESFIKAASYVSDITVSAVYSRSPEGGAAFAEKNGVPLSFCSLDEMLKSSDIDAVYLASPNSLHFSQGKMCLENGKHLLCEKPATVTSRELSELYRIADDRGLIFLEAMKSMHSPGLTVVKNAMKHLGSITSAQLDFSQLSSKYPAFLRGENPNIFNPEFSTGALMDIGVYCVYAAVELFGEPKKILSHSSFFENGSDHSGALVFVYDSLSVTINYSKVADGFLGSKLLGDKGTLVIDSLSKMTGIRLYKKGEEPRELYNEDETLIMSKELESFRDFALGKSMDFYGRCKATAFTVCRIMENIRKENNFAF